MLCCAGVHNNEPSASNLKTHISYWLANNAINPLNTEQIHSYSVQRHLEEEIKFLIGILIFYAYIFIIDIFNSWLLVSKGGIQNRYLQSIGIRCGNFSNQVYYVLKCLDTSVQLYEKQNLKYFSPIQSSSHKGWNVDQPFSTSYIPSKIDYFSIYFISVRTSTSSPLN